MALKSRHLLRLLLLCPSSIAQYISGDSSIPAVRRFFSPRRCKRCFRYSEIYSLINLKLVTIFSNYLLRCSPDFIFLHSHVAEKFTCLIHGIEKGEPIMNGFDFRFSFDEAECVCLINSPSLFVSCVVELIIAPSVRIFSLLEVFEG